MLTPSAATLKGDPSVVTRIDRIDPDSVGAVRAKLKLSQSEFARNLLLAPGGVRTSDQTMELPTKTVGRPFTAETHWARFRRLQRTAGKVMGGLPYARGVQRFRTVEESDTWQMEQRLNRPDRPKIAI